MRALLGMILVVPLVVGCGGGDEKSEDERIEGTEPGDCTDDNRLATLRDIFDRFARKRRAWSREA